MEKDGSKDDSKAEGVACSGEHAQGAHEVFPQGMGLSKAVRALRSHRNGKRGLSLARILGTTTLRLTNRGPQGGLT